jgi:hypothetical protein
VVGLLLVLLSAKLVGLLMLELMTVVVGLSWEMV